MVQPNRESGREFLEWHIADLARQIEEHDAKGKDLARQKQAAEVVLAGIDGAALIISPDAVVPELSGSSVSDDGAFGATEGPAQMVEPSAVPSVPDVEAWLDPDLYDCSQSYTVIATVVARHKKGSVRVTEVQQVAEVIGKHRGSAGNLWSTINNRLRDHKDFRKVDGGVYEWLLFSPDEALPATACR